MALKLTADCSFSSFSSPYFKPVLRNGPYSRSSDGLYICNVRNKSFGDSFNLLMHYLTHTGERPHLCNECGKCFTQFSNLKTHAVVHAGERSRLCKDCGKCFRRAAHLQKHALLHTDLMYVLSAQTHLYAWLIWGTILLYTLWTGHMSARCVPRRLQRQLNCGDIATHTTALHDVGSFSTVVKCGQLASYWEPYGNVRNLLASFVQRQVFAHIPLSTYISGTAGAHHRCASLLCRCIILWQTLVSGSLLCISLSPHLFLALLKRLEVHVFWVGKRFLVFWTAGTTCPVTQCHWASGSWCSQQPALPAQWHNAIRLESQQLCCQNLKCWIFKCHLCIFINAVSFIQAVPFVAAQSAAALSHRQSVCARTSGDSCSAEHIDKTNTHRIIQVWHHSATVCSAAHCPQ